MPWLSFAHCRSVHSHMCVNNTACANGCKNPTKTLRYELTGLLNQNCPGYTCSPNCTTASLSCTQVADPINDPLAHCTQRKHICVYM